MQKKFKILSFDGGGTWSIIQLLTLKERYGGERKGHDILKEYDLVISNSGGSIVLATLCCNWSLDQAIQFFNNECQRVRIFVKNGFLQRYFPTNILRFFGFGPKYSTDEKYEALADIFKEVDGKELKDLPAYVGKDSLKIVVCNYDAINNRAKFFKSYKGKSESFESVDFIRSIHGSSNPPVNYFDFPARFEVKGGKSDDFFAWDGALGGFNNPVAAGVIEAINLDVDKESIFVVSLGTYNKSMPKGEEDKFKNQYQRLKKNRYFLFGKGCNFFFKTTTHLARSILYGPPDWANYVAYVLRFNGSEDHTNNIKQFIRLSPMIHTNSDMIEDTKCLMDKLYPLDLDLIKECDVKLVRKCFEAWKKGEMINQPIRGRIDEKGNLSHKIGFPSFEEGMLAWKRM